MISYKGLTPKKGLNGIMHYHHNQYNNFNSNEMEDLDPEYADPDDPEIIIETLITQMNKIKEMMRNSEDGSIEFDFPLPDIISDILCSITQSTKSTLVPDELVMDPIIFMFIDKIIQNFSENERMINFVATFYLNITFYEFNDIMQVILNKFDYFLNIPFLEAKNSYINSLTNLLVDPKPRQLIVDLEIPILILEIMMNSKDILNFSCVQFLHNLACCFLSEEIEINPEIFTLSLNILILILLKFTNINFTDVSNNSNETNNSMIIENKDTHITPADNRSNKSNSDTMNNHPAADNETVNKSTNEIIVNSKIMIHTEQPNPANDNMLQNNEILAEDNCENTVAEFDAVSILRYICILVRYPSFMAFGLQNELEKCILSLLIQNDERIADSLFEIITNVLKYLQCKSIILKFNGFYELFDSLFDKSMDNAKLEGIELLTVLIPSHIEIVGQLKSFHYIIQNSGSLFFEMFKSASKLITKFLYYLPNSLNNVFVTPEIIDIFIRSLESRDEECVLHVLEFLQNISDRDPIFWDPIITKSGILHIAEEIESEDNEKIAKFARNLLNNFLTK
ncbi:hypothetical protein TRFO_07351 [Tritrichomonas foetus]|uniref:Uncharacterized protein n=1 Tax=Tritrichomonas foetus TaxID=1144522 RepID=A0A1J4JTP1_9EUKA|nr:hypothetical protein TRFO_07351 [Tritrichomonas foetus]|eukprot:OHT01800.1 hypothetical protein TRFO_07351 [Tritrichomonas foetus]